MLCQPRVRISRVAYLKTPLTIALVGFSYHVAPNERRTNGDARLMRALFCAPNRMGLDSSVSRRARPARCLMTSESCDRRSLSYSFGRRSPQMLGQRDPGSQVGTLIAARVEAVFPVLSPEGDPSWPHVS